MKQFPLTKCKNFTSARSNLKVICLFTIAFSLISTSCKKSIQEPADQPTLVADAKGVSGMIGINVLLKSAITDGIVKELNAYGTVIDLIPEIKSLTMRIAAGNLSLIQKLSYVSQANPDATRKGSPVDAVSATNFSNGLSMWNLDAINVTNPGVGRTINNDGSGVYIGVLDSGLPDSWRQYFPQERVATQYAKSFGGGGGPNGNVSEQPNKWEHDQYTHGGHVTSTIIGFQFGTVYFNGVAPKATIIPVKVLNQNGNGWSSVIARGIVYIAELKDGALHNSPVVINMSLGGPGLDAMEQAAIDYAISKGVIIVAAAGNEGEQGMSYPGAYQPVISAASAGWTGQWTSPTWWYAANVPDPTNSADLFISDFSSREKPGQDLDVAAPGDWVVGPFQENSGHVAYFYVSGTSMATPHVTGIVALMAQQKPSLTATEAETTLESAAIPIGAGSRSITLVDGTVSTISWGSNATGHGFITATAALAALP